MLHDILVHRYGGDPEQNTGEDGGDDPWDPTQDAKEITVRV